MKNSDICLALSMVDGLGPKRIRGLLDEAGSWDRVWTANQNDWHSLSRNISGLTMKHWHSLERLHTTFDPTDFRASLRRQGIQVTGMADPGYPEHLKNTLAMQAPVALYHRGALPQYPGLGIVGTRNPTPLGQEQAVEFAMHLAEQNVPIISGLARGIDSCAHRACLRVKGFTGAVLGTPLSQVYPRENVLLADDIARSGALISEYYPGQRVQRGCFPWRNRIIAGLCRGVLVVESGTPSGALNTATWAAELGIDLFTIPGQAKETKRAGNHQLLREGAHLVEEPDEICRMWSLNQTGATADQETIASMLAAGLTPSQIAERLQLQPEEVLPKITALQLGLDL